MGFFTKKKEKVNREKTVNPDGFDSPVVDDDEFCSYKAPKT